MSVATAIIDYGKELMKHKNADDHYIGEVLWALGYKVLSEETEMTRRKYESGQSNRAQEGMAETVPRIESCEP